jgi:hypothetical protein
MKWRWITGFVGQYAISDTGLVYNMKRRKFLNPRRTAYGYLSMALRMRGKKFTKQVHRMVAEEFIPNPDGLTRVRHKDGDRTNNHVSNLEWCGKGMWE